MPDPREMEMRKAAWDRMRELQRWATDRRRDTAVHRGGRRLLLILAKQAAVGFRAVQVRCMR